MQLTRLVGLLHSWFSFLLLHVCNPIPSTRPGYIIILKLYLSVHLSVRYGKSPEVALTPSPKLAFRSTDKSGHLRDGKAESARTTIANVSTFSYVGTRGNNKRERHTWKWPHHRATKSKEEESSTLTASTVDGDYVLNSIMNAASFLGDERCLGPHPLLMQ